MEEAYENQTGDQAEAAAPAVESSQETEQAQATQEQQVPLEALQALRSEKQQLADELKMVKDYLSVMNQQRSQTQEKPKDEWDNYSEDDVLTVGEAKKFLNKLNQQYQMSIEELRMIQKHNDYQDVVTKYLPDVLKTNPSLAQTLEQTKNYELAYYLAKTSEGYQKDHKKSKKNADAERIVQNANKAGSLSSVGQTSPINQAKRYNQMSDDEFKMEMSKNLGYF